MLESWTYKGYTIEYSPMSGTTRVMDCGFNMVRFTGLGYQRGKIKAESFIDDIVSKPV